MSGTAGASSAPSAGCGSWSGWAPAGHRLAPRAEPGPTEQSVLAAEGVERCRQRGALLAYWNMRVAER